MISEGPLILQYRARLKWRPLCIVLRGDILCGFRSLRHREREHPKTTKKSNLRTEHEGMLGNVPTGNG
jgi:hypothetical protein